MAVTVIVARAQITARDGTGPVIATIGGITYHAYRKLTGIHLVGRRWYWWRFVPLTEDYRIDSTPADLMLDAGASNFLGPENLQVYSGQLNVSWKRTLFRLIVIGQGQAVSTVSVRLRYRTDTNNQLLNCYDSADPEDGNALICVDVVIPIVRGARTCSSFLNAKSNSPLRAGVAQADPALYVVRSATFHVDPFCVFG